MALEGRRVLYISYNGMLDPLGQSQVLPYLRELGKRGVRFTLLSFERRAPSYRGLSGPQQSQAGIHSPDSSSTGFEDHDLERFEELHRRLADEGIDWHWLRYHQRPSLPATMFDVANGIRLAQKLVREKRIELVHARSHIPATMALALKRQFGVKLIFDIRGLMADEYVDANHWKKGSIPYRLTKAMERRALAASDGIVTLTEGIWPIIQEWPGLRGRNDVVHEVVPCCADLERFKFSNDDRKRRRDELGLANHFVIVYSGSIDGWYLTEKMADFFAAVRKKKADAHFLWLTPAKHGRIRELMRERAIKEDRYTILAAAPNAVPSYLSASDVGLAFIKPCFSKLASSPTKYAEYLGCGLPLIINSGIGDSDALITQEGVGALVGEFNEAAYAGAISTIEDLARAVSEARRRTREVAERLFDLRKVGIELYARMYEKILVH